ncbi:siderophore-interacting protein [Endozoicomonadaceae bacterium StTr2]
MSRPAPRELTVKDITPLSPNLRRFTFIGESLSDFPVDQASAYVKLVFDSAEEGQRPMMRSMTVVDSNNQAKELVLDIALHNQDSPEKLGPAGQWVGQAKPGDSIKVAGPGDTKLVDFSADWFFMAGDLTALPAIRANLHKMPADAKGYVVLEVPEAEDKAALQIEPGQLPEGIEIHWVVNPEPGTHHDQLKQKALSLPWLSGTPYIWAAGELKSVLELRNHLNQTMPAPRPPRYISSYWQKGLDDTRHKQEKKRQLAE